ncbi:MAG: dTMP kinase [Chloroflexota bacterium]|nr:dTMP kinase [Chloroflexota bacterium]
MGKFVVFEGPEGGGKTLQAGLLADTLRIAGLDVVQTREPGGTRVGDKIRSVLLELGDYTILPETEVLLLAAARAQHVREVIHPALERGAWVICDRFVDSTYAYQVGGSGLDLGPIRTIQAFATNGLEPDIRILLDVPVATGLQRRYADAESVNRIDLADITYHQRVRDQYLALAAGNPRGWVVIDAQGSADSVQTIVWRQVRESLAIA